MSQVDILDLTARAIFESIFVYIHSIITPIATLFFDLQVITEEMKEL